MSKPTVAIIGTSGFLGKPVLEAFQSSIFADKFQFPIKAVSRSSKDSTDKVEYVQGDLDDASGLAEKLKGTDVLISLANANPQLFIKTENLVHHLKPKLYIPSQFGTEIDKASKVLPGFVTFKDEHSKRLRATGIKVVDIITSLFAVPGTLLYLVIGAVGGDPKTKTVTYRGDPDAKFNVSLLEDIGNSVASVASLDPSQLPNKVRVYSDRVSQREIIERYEKTHNVKFEVKTESIEEALKNGQAKYAQGFQPADFLYYLQLIISQGEDKGLAFKDDEREIVNPGEKLWKWGKY